MTKSAQYSGIMVSSTFADLEEHRSQLKDAILELGWFPNVMEHSGPNVSADVIDTSLKMVEDCAVFTSVISHRYGETPECSTRNPEGLSLSELEFDKALELSRPILLFYMGDEHPITRADVETDPIKFQKLEAFKNKAKMMQRSGKVTRVYSVFNSLQEFTQAATLALGKLPKPKSVTAEGKDQFDASPIDAITLTKAPDLRAVPRYLGSHDFLGRKNELTKLDDWARVSDQHPILLFEAIGGSGKSMVTWTWLERNASKIRSDWAGKFWFSFYERGATMTEFCRQALAYMTGKPPSDYHRTSMAEMSDQLVALLRAKPWLLVLDGMERILVSYHRIDAPHLRDDEVDTATDQIGNRDPCATINAADERLLRELSAAAPSKLLVTSRLTPDALVNPSGMPIPGVRRETLGGLRPNDAEALMRACGVTGQSDELQSYLQTNCDCHPLVVGVLAGEINRYRPDRGNFDAWLADPQAGGRLELAKLDLTQRRNHILSQSMLSLPDDAKKLLRTLALLEAGADYEVLRELNPMVPRPPKEVPEPEDPREKLFWDRMSSDWQQNQLNSYRSEEKKRSEYSKKFDEWKASAEYAAGPSKLDEALTALEQGGFLQYETGLKLYNLHPVVRGVSSGEMNQAETEALGEHVVDFFSSRSKPAFEDAASVADLSDTLQIVSTRARMKHYSRVLSLVSGELSRTLLRLLAAKEALAILRPFFPEGWDGPILVDEKRQQAQVLKMARNAFWSSSEHRELLVRLCDRLLRTILSTGDSYDLDEAVSNLGRAHMQNYRFNAALKLLDYEVQMTELLPSISEYSRGMTLEEGFDLWATLGNEAKAKEKQEKLEEIEKTTSSEQLLDSIFVTRNRVRLYFEELDQELLNSVNSRFRKKRDLRRLFESLRVSFLWFSEQKNEQQALKCAEELLAIARQTSSNLYSAVVMYALAAARTDNKVEALELIERNDGIREADDSYLLGELWHELGDLEKAKVFALEAHQKACADGEPYVHRYWLNKSTDLLRRLGVEPPPIQQFDPANAKKFEWEDDLRAKIAQLEKEKKEREARARERAANDE